MRKITQTIKDAWESGEEKRVGNTATDGTNVYLHNNLIVRRNEDGSVHATLAGWNTPTTRERIKGITGADIFCRKFEAYVGDEAIGNNEWFEVSRPKVSREKVSALLDSLIRL
jgi:hypothetical protein